MTTSSPLEQEEDDLPAGRVVRAVVVAVAVGVAGVGGAAWLLQRGPPPWSGASPRAPELLYGIHQTRFGERALGRAGNEEASRRLASYGVVDAATGTVHIPIDEAMALLIERQRPRTP